MTQIYSFKEEKSRRRLPEGTATESNYTLDAAADASGKIPDITRDRSLLMEGLREVCEETQAEDWDGDGARPIALVTSENAQRLIEHLPDLLPDPEIIPDDDGYLELEWYENGKSFSFYITPSETVLYAEYLDPNNRSSGRFTYEDELPEHLVVRIRGIYNDATHHNDAARAVSL